MRWGAFSSSGERLLSSEHRAQTSRRSIYLTLPITFGTRLDPVQTTSHRMESYVQFDQRSDIEFYTRQPEREDLPQLLQHQAQLPSFRDVSLSLLTLSSSIVTAADTASDHCTSPSAFGGGSTTADITDCSGF